MFKKPTVDSILSSFSKTVTALRNVADQHADEAARQAGIALDASIAMDDAKAESRRATAAANRIEALLS